MRISVVLSLFFLACAACKPTRGSVQSIQQDTIKAQTWAIAKEDTLPSFIFQDCIINTSSLLEVNIPLGAKKMSTYSFPQEYDDTNDSDSKNTIITESANIVYDFYDKTKGYTSDCYHSLVNLGVNPNDDIIRHKYDVLIDSTMKVIGYSLLKNDTLLYLIDNQKYANIGPAGDSGLTSLNYIYCSVLKNNKLASPVLIHYSERGIIFSVFRAFYIDDEYIYVKDFYIGEQSIENYNNRKFKILKDTIVRM